MNKRSDLLKPFSTPQPDVELRQRTLRAALAVGKEHHPAPSWIIGIIDQLGTSRVARWSWATAMGLLLLANLAGSRAEVVHSVTEPVQRAASNPLPIDELSDDFASFSAPWWATLGNELTLSEVFPKPIEEIEQIESSI